MEKSEAIGTMIFYNSGGTAKGFLTSDVLTATKSAVVFSPQSVLK